MLTLINSCHFVFSDKLLVAVHTATTVLSTHRDLFILFISIIKSTLETKVCSSLFILRGKREKAGQKLKASLLKKDFRIQLKTQNFREVNATVPEKLDKTNATVPR